MKKKILTVITAIIIVLIMPVMTGCEGGGSANIFETKIVTDCANRQVEIPESPQRVAVMYATAAHMMAMLDEQEKIVGCPNGVKNDLLMKMKYPEITDTATPHQEGAINIEEMVRIKADLAVVNTATSANAGQMSKLDDMGIPYIVIDYDTFDELKQALRVMGEVFGDEDKAEAYVAFMEETIGMVRQRIGEVPRDKWPRVYHSSNEATRTDTEENICNEIMNMACVKNIAIEEGVTGKGKSQYVTLEEIYKWNPDAIIANEFSVTDYVLSDSKWAGLKAVKEDKVYTLPVGAARWCHPGSMEAHMGVLAVAIDFYPEKFTDFNLRTYIKSYYKEYFGIDLNERIVNNIIKGEGMRQVNSPTQ